MGNKKEDKKITYTITADNTVDRMNELTEGLLSTFTSDTVLSEVKANLLKQSLDEIASIKTKNFKNRDIKLLKYNNNSDLKTLLYYISDAIIFLNNSDNMQFSETQYLNIYLNEMQEDSHLGREKEFTKEFLSYMQSNVNQYLLKNNVEPISSLVVDDNRATGYSR